MRILAELTNVRTLRNEPLFERSFFVLFFINAIHFEVLYCAIHGGMLKPYKLYTEGQEKTRSIFIQCDHIRKNLFYTYHFTFSYIRIVNKTITHVKYE